MTCRMFAAPEPREASWSAAVPLPLLTDEAADGLGNFERVRWHHPAFQSFDSPHVGG